MVLYASMHLPVETPVRLQSIPVAELKIVHDRSWTRGVSKLLNDIHDVEDAIVVIDHSGFVLSANPSASHLFDDSVYVRNRRLKITDQQSRFVSIEPKPRPNASLLSKIFGLTFAEAKLAAALADGTSLDTAAEELDIARQTARSQLKIVFAKTDTHRQGPGCRRGVRQLSKGTQVTKYGLT